MEENDKEVMRKMHVKLVKELDTTGLLLDYLYQEKTLTDEDVEKIKAKKTTKKKAEKLLKILKKRRRGLKMLIKALILTDVQDFLAFEILEKTNWSEEEKNSFRQKLDGKLDEQQKLTLELACMKDEIQKLKSRCQEYERRLKEEKEERERLQTNKSSREASNSSVFLKLFRRSQKNLKQDKAISTEDDNSKPQSVFTIGPATPLHSECSTIQDLYPQLSKVAVRDFTRSNKVQRANSVPGSRPVLPDLLDDDDDDDVDYLFDFGVERIRRDLRRTHSSSVPPWEMEDRRTDLELRSGSRASSRTGSRAGSVVSSASLKLRNAYASFRRNQETDRHQYSNL